MLNFRNKLKEPQPKPDLGFKEFPRMCSEKWRSVSKHEKAKYEGLAKLDRAGSQEEMMNDMGELRQRRKRDPKAPVQAPPSFLLFSLDHNAKRKQENPSWTGVQEAKATGKMWSLTADVDKKAYEEKAGLMRAKDFEEREA